MLVLFMFAVSAFLYAQQKSEAQRGGVKIHNGFWKAEAYLNLHSEDQWLYAAGLMDGMDMAPYFGAPEDNKSLVGVQKCVEGMQASQVAAIIEKYIRDHPERWDWDAKDMGYNALLQACRNR